MKKHVQRRPGRPDGRRRSAPRHRRAQPAATVLRDQRPPSSRPSRARRVRRWEGLPALIRLPFALIGHLALHIVQVVLSIIIGILHPSFRWLVRLLLRSGLVRNYIRPTLDVLIERLYDPYFAWLRG